MTKHGAIGKTFLLNGNMGLLSTPVLKQKEDGEEEEPQLQPVAATQTGDMAHR